MCNQPKEEPSDEEFNAAYEEWLSEGYSDEFYTQWAAIDLNEEESG